MALQAGRPGKAEVHGLLGFTGPPLPTVSVSEQFLCPCRCPANVLEIGQVMDPQPCHMTVSRVFLGLSLRPSGTMYTVLFAVLLPSVESTSWLGANFPSLSVSFSRLCGPQHIGLDRICPCRMPVSGSDVAPCYHLLSHPLQSLRASRLVPETRCD